MIAIDTNILARFYIEDPSDREAASQARRARRVMLDSPALFVPLTVVLELEWVMRGFYRLPPEAICSALRHLLGMGNVTVQHWEAVNDAVSLHDAASGMIIEANDRLVDTFGYSRNEARNLEIGDLSADQAPYTREWLRGWFRRAGRGETPDFEWRARRRDGSLFPAEIHMRRTEVAGHACVLVFIRSLEDRTRPAAAPDEKAQPG